MKRIIVVFCLLSIFSICSCTKNNNKSISSDTTTQSNVKENNKISNETAIEYAKNKTISYLSTSGYDSSKMSQPTWGNITYDTSSSEDQYIVTLKGYCLYYNDYGEYTGAKVKFSITVKVPYNAASYNESIIDYSKSDTELTYN